MNEHKVNQVKVFVKQGSRLTEIIPPKPTDIQSRPISVMGHYVGEGHIKEIRLGLPAGTFAKACPK